MFNKEKQSNKDENDLIKFLDEGVEPDEDFKDSLKNQMNNKFEKVSIGQKVKEFFDLRSWKNSFESLNWRSASLATLGVLLILGVSGLSYQLFVDTNKNNGWTDQYGKDWQVGQDSVAEEIEANKSLYAKGSDIVKFASEDEFKEYLEEAKQTYDRPIFLTGDLWEEEGSLQKSDMDSTANESLEASDETVDRVSETNVQTAGIDEPDYVKTDGQYIYLSDEYSYYNSRVVTDKACEGDDCGSINKVSTKIIKAWPFENMDLKSEISETGQLFTKDNILVVLNNNNILGYDVSDPENPDEIWKYRIEDNLSVADSRMYNGELYLVAKKYLYDETPCVFPLLQGEAGDVEKAEIDCQDIYYPSTINGNNINYTVLKLDISDGQIKNKLSFMGESGVNITYMSLENLYLSYSLNQNNFDFLAKALEETSKDLFEDDFFEKVEDLKSYDISEHSKYSELYTLINEHKSKMRDDEQDVFVDRLNDYYKENKRVLERTGIVKIDIEDLEIKGNGSVPGQLLNQFSFDEYEGNLRIATTINAQYYWYDQKDQDVSVNDVYVLDENLEIISGAYNLGEDERIYSVRFMGDKGYIVTFKQIDPFYVLDLSNPKDIIVEGELKIPGFSSYLHPLEENLIVGIGKEDRQVKISLFDVSDPKDPEEISKYQLDDFWSEVESTHHAFLQDDKHEVFFLPSGQSGIVMSYADNELELVKKVEDINARRAIFINDYLYVIGDSKIKVLDENDWEEVKEFEFEED